MYSEVIEFGDSYKAPIDDAATGSATEGSAKKKGRTVAVTTEDMQKRRNDVKARTTLLLALLDEHQLRINKYKTAQELWAAILKTFGRNDATRKTKKNLLKQQYGNFKAERKETLEQTFNRLHAIVSHLEFMDVEIEQDDLNQKLLTSLAPEWLMHTIVWRNRSDLDTMSLDDLYNHLKVYEPEVQKKLDSHNMAFIYSANNSSGNGEVNTASIPTVSTQVSPASANVAAASISLDTACAYIASQSNGSQIKYWKKTGKKISIQGTDVAGFDKSKVESFNCHKMGHFARECRAPRSQDRGRRENYKQGSKVEEQAPKALMAIDGVGWDWSYIANKEENHALVADEEAPTEFALMAKSSSDNEGNSQNNIDDKGYWNSGCTQYMTATYPIFLTMSHIMEGMCHLDKVVARLSVKELSKLLKDDTNVLLRTPRQHNMYSIDFNNVVPHKDTTCLVAKASADECMLCHRRLGHLNFKTMNRFTWTFFLKTKDETSGILRNFITEIENLKELKNEVVKRRNRTLIEAARTMLADAKLLVTFWAEAVNTACYVQNRVLGSLRQKGIKVILLGTKEAASQDVKKDVSSLRYISLPNWFHEAHLDSSTSNAQDACKTDALESSGNSNPTATSTNPSTDQIETLTVETPIPTISSLVPTACLDDSLKLLSDTRLISKRVTSQENSPSLDNILTFSNRFEDILGVTTNTGDTNGVEADLSNMENNISASPTPTFRIHKDHPKS
nr:hypothetical protein [Tanacetum cinerariifolium]